MYLVQGVNNLFRLFLSTRMTIIALATSILIDVGALYGIMYSKFHSFVDLRRMLLLINIAL